MSEAKQAPPTENFPWKAVVTVTAGLLASGVLLLPFLTSSRPNIPWGGRSEGMSIQDIDARLWEDPLKAVNSPHYLFGTSYDKKVHNVDLARQMLTNDAKAPLILAVMVNGAGYAEKIERRLRDRVAVENALDRAGYSPNDAEHIGSFTIPWPRQPENLCAIQSWEDISRVTTPSPPDTARRKRSHSKRTPTVAAAAVSNSTVTSAATQERSGSKWRRGDCDKAWSGGDDPDRAWLTVPFEVHKLDPVEFPNRDDGIKMGRSDKILVLWLRQNFFDDAPLARLAELFSWFQTSDNQLCASLKVLGPDTSDPLLQLIDEIKDQSANQGLSGGDVAAKHREWEQVEHILNGATMFAYRPTASDKILLRNNDAKPGDAKKLIESGCKGLKFYRTTATDDALMGELKRELLRRHINPSPERVAEVECLPVLGCSGAALPREDFVAIISEQDTLFARALHRTFNMALSRKPELSNVDLISYLRGIDGRTVIASADGAPGTSRAAAANSNSATGANTSANQRVPREIPEGTDQSDYIRRLAKQLTAADKLRYAESRPGVKAIGVLGSDVYDKLEILHALRTGPRAKIFFTNGLDARFFHPEEVKATRNLVVISGFGLSLDRYYQGNIPPFRDHNQTAAFAAALCALGIMDADNVEFNKHIRVFEISKRGAIDLSNDEKSDLTEFNDNPKEPTDDIHPARHDLRNWWQKIGAKRHWWQGLNWWRFLPGFSLIVLVCAVIFGRYYIWSDSKENSLRCFGKSTAAALLISLVLIAFVLVPCYYLQRGVGEPFGLLNGASMWPSEAIRLFVLIISVHFVIKSLILLKENEKEITPAFGFDNPAITPVPPAELKELFLWKSKLHTGPDGQKGPDIRTLWGEYLYRNKASLRLTSTFLWFLVYALAVILLAGGTQMLGSTQIFIPARGNLMFKIERIAVVLAAASSVFLTLFVVHATLLDARFTRLVNKGPSIWDETTRKKYQQNGIADFVGEYLDIMLIARRTRAVTQLIYYPLITISLLVICRLPEFDNFDWPMPLILILGFNGLLACGCALILRSLAEAARRESIRRLGEHLCHSRADNDRTLCATIEGLIKEVQELDQGIFAPVTRQPLVGALLLPSGSAGIWALLQYFR